MNGRVIGGMTLFLVAVLLIVNAGVGGGQTETTDTFPATEQEQKYVTVTFDDAYASQYRAADALEERGMRGVYLVPVGRLNDSFEGIPTMSPGQVQELQARGHEIGGHTYNHTDLSTLDAAQVDESLERNRDALNVLGIDPVSFAYPYGQGTEHAAVVEQYYTYTRTVDWGLNVVPPRDPGSLATVSLTEETYEFLDDYLAQMEDGDWLVISLHHVDNGTVDRADVDVSRETYERILDRIEQADVEVVTFRDVQGLEG